MRQLGEHICWCCTRVNQDYIRLTGIGSHNRAREFRRIYHSYLTEFGLPAADPPKSLTVEERAELATNQVAFFWAMCNITAKKIARGQRWGALSMFGLLSDALEEAEWLVGLREERPGHKDTRTGLPPVQPADQMTLLREMARSMEGIMPQVEALGGSVTVEAIPQVYRFFEVVDAMLEQ